MDVVKLAWLKDKNSKQQRLEACRRRSYHDDEACPVFAEQTGGPVRGVCQITANSQINGIKQLRQLLLSYDPTVRPEPQKEEETGNKTNR